ncbi:MAG: hypothetical protein ABJN65_11605 [Parasphingorhabdus sp.]
MRTFLIAFGLALHLAVAIWNGFFGPSFGAEGDALEFHREAQYYAENLENFEYETGWIYSYALGVLYAVFFTDHIFFGSIISVFAWLVSAILFGRILDCYNGSDRYKEISMALFCIWPTMLLNTSVTLREVFQVLAINMILLASLRIFVQNQNRWTLLIAGMILGSVLHGTLLAFSAGIFALLVYFYINSASGATKAARMTFGIAFGMVGIFIVLSLFGVIAYDVDDGLVAAIQSYNEGAIAANARADYRTEGFIEGPYDLIIFLPTAFFQYMLEPLPANVGTVADMLLFMENLARLLLIIIAIRGIFRADGITRKALLFSFLAYLALEALWSVGTVNWGTASRHHVPAMGLLLSIAFYEPIRSRLKKSKAGDGARQYSNYDNRKRSAY